MTGSNRRAPWIAGLLSLALTGLGHFYVGKAKRGVFFFLGLYILFALLLGLLVFTLNIYSLLLCVVLLAVYSILVIVDAMKIAKVQSASYSLKWYNRWYYYVALFVLIMTTFSAFDTTKWVKDNLFSSARGTTGSMEPTFLHGDLFFVNYFIYRVKKPQRGDVVVFRHPQATPPLHRFMKRLIGIEGDVIEIKNNHLFVNGIENREDYEKEKEVSGESRVVNENFGPVTVPPNSFFLLGDNRDDSYDSRHWGFVPEEDIIGKTTSIYWSWDKDKKTIRWDRIGKRF